MSDVSEFDVQWRPDSYVVPHDATEAFLMGVRGTARRAAITECLQEGDVESAAALRAEPERTPGELPPFPLREGASLAGEHLPEYEDGEFDLVRIEFANRERDVVCVRARARLDGWELRVVDERGRRFHPRRPWYKERLTLGQIVEYVNAVRLECGLQGLVLGLFLDIGRTAGSFEKAYAGELGSPVRVTSPFYPQLGVGYAGMLREYMASPAFHALRARLEDAATDAGHAAPAPPMDAPRSPHDIVRGGRLARELVAERCERVVNGGDDGEVLAFVAAHEQALAGVENGLGELALITGLACERAGRFELARQVYDQGLSYRPVARSVRYWLHNNAAYSLVQLGRHEAALGHSRAAIGLQPERHNAWKNHGLALAGVGQPVEAARALVKAYQLCPDDIRALAHLEDLMAEHGGAILQEVPEVREFMCDGGGGAPGGGTEV